MRSGIPEWQIAHPSVRKSYSGKSAQIMVKFTNEGLREAEYRREYLKQLEIQLPEIRNDL